MRTDAPEGNDTNDGSYGEDNVSARVGSTEALDKIEEDFNRSGTTQATGYYGKTSELTWIQRLRQQTADDSEHSDVDTLSDTHPSIRGNAFGPGITPISDSTYHCDDQSVLVSERVDPFELPPKSVSDAFLQSFLDTVHPAFPILGKSIFKSQYQAFFDHGRNANNDWRAILNMIFAIAAKYAHLIQADWRGDDRDHLI